MVRVLGRDGSWIGSGFLIPAHRVGVCVFVTCAHVVAEAAGEPGRAMGDKALRARIPILFEGALSAGRYYAQVIQEEELPAGHIAWNKRENQPVGRSAPQDVAILRILDAQNEEVDDLPSGVSLAALSSRYAVGEDVFAFGNPNADVPGESDLGTWTNPMGKAAPRTAGFIQFTVTDRILHTRAQKDVGVRIRGGHSGGPLWSYKQSAIIGMVTLAHTEEQQAMATSIEEIVQAWPPIDARDVEDDTEISTHFWSIDREAQMFDLNITIDRTHASMPQNALKRPILLALTGPQEAAHYAMRDRFRTDVIAERFPHLEVVPTIFLDWPESGSLVRRLMMLRGLFFNQLGLGYTATDEQVVAALNAHSDAIMLVIELDTSFTAGCVELMLAWLDDWKRYQDPALGLNTEIYVVISLCFSDEKHAGTPIADFVSATLPQHFPLATDGDNQVALEPLSPIRFSDVQSWYYGLLKSPGFQPTVDQNMLMQQFSGLFKNGPIHMGALLEKIQKERITM